MKLEFNNDSISSHMLFDSRIAYEWLDTEQAARFLKRSVGAVRNLVYRNKLKFYKHDRKLMFRLSDLRAFLAKGV